MAASSFRADSAEITGSLKQSTEHRYGYYYGTADLGNAPALSSGVHLPFGYVNTERSGISGEVTYVSPSSGSLDRMMVRFLSGTSSPAFGPGAGSISTVIGQLTASMRASSGRLSTTGNHSEDVYITSALSFDTGILFQFSGSNHFNPGDHIALKLTSTNDITSANTLTTMYTTVFKYKLD
jgi:hypothetical protein